MSTHEARKGNLEASLALSTNPCTTPAYYYGRNVITSKASGRFPLELHNANERRTPTEAAETAPAVLLVI